MGEIEDKKKASLLVLEAMMKMRNEKINPYIAIGAFIDEVIRELAKQNDDNKIALFLENIAEKVRQAIYSKKKN